MKDNNKKLTHDAGLYYVAGELSKRKFRVSLENTKYISVTSNDNKTEIRIKVSATWDSRGGRKWVLNKKIEEVAEENLFYIFVNLLQGDKRPEFFIIHSTELSNKIKTEYESWLKTHGEKGKEHNDNLLRQFADKEGKYLEKWNVLTEIK